MAETARSSGEDVNSPEQHTSPTQPPREPDAVEMENLPPKASSNEPTNEPSATSTSNATEARTDTEEPKGSVPDENAPVESQPPPAPAAAIGVPVVEGAAAPKGKPASATSEHDELTIDLAEPSPAHIPGDGDQVVDIMLIVTSSNSRHPFRISERYLTKRNVAVTGTTDDGRMDPFSITVYTLKELILRDWRKEWEAAPREPTSIRLIYFGKMLEDRLPLSHYNFSHNSKNVVHMTVKPQEIVDEEEANRKVKESSHSGGRSGCCVIL